MDSPVLPLRGIALRAAEFGTITAVQKEGAHFRTGRDSHFALEALHDEVPPK